MTGPFVLDASMTLSWAFEGEATPFTVAVLKSLETVHAIAPALWAFEVASALSTAERRGRMNAGEQTIFLERRRLNADRPTLKSKWEHRGHRYPFLLVDRIVEMEADRIVQQGRTVK